MSVIKPPQAKIIPTTLEKFDDIRIDNYFWLNDRENPEVIDYLNKENEYYQAMTAHTNNFQKELFEEMKEQKATKEKKIKNWFEMFVVEEMGSLDTGLIILSPKVEKCFGGEPGFREWISGLTSAKKFKEISAEEQLRYFKKSLTDEMKLRGVL